MAIPVQFLSGDLSESDSALLDTITRRSASLGPKCKLCNALRSNDTEVVKVHMQVRKGEISQQEAASRLNVSYAYFNKHYAHHIPNEVQLAAMPMAEELAKNEINALATLQGHARQLSGRLDQWMRTSIGDPRVEAAIKMLASEVRMWIEVIEKLKGNLTTSPILQLNQINIEMQKLETIVFEELCPNCKQRLAGRLSKEVVVSA